MMVDRGKYWLSRGSVMQFRLVMYNMMRGCWVLRACMVDQAMMRCCYYMMGGRRVMEDMMGSG